MIKMRAVVGKKHWAFSIFLLLALIINVSEVHSRGVHEERRGAFLEPDSLIFSDGFDEDADGNGLPDQWVVEGDAALDTSEGHQHWSLRFVGTPGGNVRARSIAIDVEPETLYRLTWYCQTEGVGSYVSCSINLGGWVVESEEEHQGDSVSWTEHQFLFTTPVDAISGRILFQLRGEGLAWIDDVKVERYDFSLSDPEIISENARILHNESDSLVIWVNYPVMKVFQNDYLSPTLPESDTIIVSMAKGEYEPFQLLLYSTDSLSNVEVTVGHLHGDVDVISNENVTLNTVHYAEVAQEWIHVPEGRAGFYPDALPWESTADVSPGRHTPFWITLFTPMDIQSGTYQGTVYISGPVDWSFPIQIHVWDFTLPNNPSLRASGADGALLSSALDHIDHRPEGERIADWFENMRRHRISGTRYVEYILNDEDWLQIAGDSLIMEFALFDDVVSEYLTQGMTMMALPPVPLASQRRPLGTTLWLGLTPLTPEFNRFFTDYCRQLGEHLDHMDLLDTAYIMLWDEPNTEDYDDVLALYSLVRDGHPGLITMLTEEPVPELYGVVDLWFPNLRRLAASELQDRFEERQAVRDFVGAYGNDRYSMVHPLTYMRLWPWTMKLYGLTDTGWYAVLSARLDIWDNPVVPGSHEGYTGKEIPGGGFYLYPDREGDGPFVNSMRWEAFRDGMEDFDYLTELEQRLNLSDPLCSEQGTEMVKDFVDELVWGNFGWEYEPHISRLYEIRDSVATLIESLGDTPIWIRGDVDMNQKSDILDVVLVIGYILGTELNACQIWTADCNGDNRVDILDVLGIVNVILETGTCTP